MLHIYLSRAPNFQLFIFILVLYVSVQVSLFLFIALCLEVLTLAFLHFKPSVDEAF